jgi:hypothetical protein
MTRLDFRYELPSGPEDQVQKTNHGYQDGRIRPEFQLGFPSHPVTIPAASLICMFPKSFKRRYRGLLETQSMQPVGHAFRLLGIGSVLDVAEFTSRCYVVSAQLRLAPVLQGTTPPPIAGSLQGR